MAEAKPFASLSSGLLARKGAAKPAMRPQGFGQMGMGMEDLGWNDMGYGAPQRPAPVERMPEHVPSSITALTPAPRSSEPHATDLQVVTPAVVEQQRSIVETFEESAPPPKTAEVVSLPRARNTPGAKGKAAFTLRLDPERHLKLRLACAVSRRSAQQLVTEALDEFLASHPELENMAGQVPATIAKRGS